MTEPGVSYIMGGHVIMVILVKVVSPTLTTPPGTTLPGTTDYPISRTTDCCPMRYYSDKS